MAGKMRIVGLGGTVRQASASEKALRLCLTHAQALGAETELFAGPDLVLPMFDPRASERTEAAANLVGALRKADGIVLSTPSYHGSVSGLVKNALDYAEDLSSDLRPYFDGRVIGLIVCADGAQAGGTTLTTLRSIAHALRGWPAPLGVAINTSVSRFDADGSCLDPAVTEQLSLLAEQVVGFGRG